MKITVKKRPISFGKRTRYVYDAKLGDFEVTNHTSAASARAAILEDSDYVSKAAQLIGGNCLLKAYRHNSWEFHLRTHMCGGSCVMLFGARDVHHAYAQLDAYREHSDAQAFFAMFDPILKASEVVS